jgi:hypothetical protein
MLWRMTESHITSDIIIIVDFLVGKSFTLAILILVANCLAATQPPTLATSSFIATPTCRVPSEQEALSLSVQYERSLRAAAGC